VVDFSIDGRLIDLERPFRPAPAAGQAAQTLGTPVGAPVSTRYSALLFFLSLVPDTLYLFS
jgi:hypothetical protein